MYIWTGIAHHFKCKIDIQNISLSNNYGCVIWRAGTDKLIKKRSSYMIIVRCQMKLFLFPFFLRFFFFLIDTNLRTNRCICWCMNSNVCIVCYECVCWRTLLVWTCFEGFRSCCVSADIWNMIAALHHTCQHSFGLILLISAPWSEGVQMW